MNLTQLMSRIANTKTKLPKIKISKPLARSLKLAAATVLPVMLTLTVVPALAQKNAQAAPLEVKIALNENIFDRAVYAKAEIVTGESQLEREKREAAEKLAKERAATYATVSTVSYTGEPSLEEKRAVYMEVASKYGVPWQLLEAVHQIESGKRWYQPNQSYVGATGPMQFMPATWRAYGQDGNGDGTADIMNPIDAIAGAANYLAANGASSGDIDNALYHYNHSWSYVAKVKSIMNSI